MKFLISSAVLLSAIMLGGCNKFLDHDPDSNRATLESPEQVSKLLVSAYPQGNYMTIVEAMSDNADEKGQGTVVPANEDSYKYRIVNADANTQDSPDNYWSSAYAAIASANQALATIEKVDNPEAYSSQKGEALLARAYAHFMLVNLYSQFYDPAGSNESMGIPYVDEPEDIVNKQYDRKTVKYVYDRIQQDLEEGLPLIEDKYYDVPKYHFTKASANAFAARFYLYKKDYNKVFEHTNNVFPGVDIQLTLRPWNTEWAAYAYQELWTNFSKATTTSNLLLVETYSLWGRYNYNYRYAATNDILKRAWSIKGAVNGNPTWTFETKLYTAGTGNYLLPKLTEYFKANSINANFGQPLVMVPLFDAEEVLFNRAEANAYLGRYDAVLSDLNKYVSKRTQNYAAAVHTVTQAKVQSYAPGLPLQDAYIKTIIDFRRMEFLFQGLRWFDMQRYKMPVTHTWRTQDNTTTETVTLQPGDPRRVLQLPTSVGLSGVPLNPR